MSDWSKFDWRGIMFGDGAIWIDENGKIISINYQSDQEKQLLVKAIQDDKKELPKSLQDFKKPFIL